MTSKFLTRNEHTVDRILRVVLGIGLLSLLAAGPLPGWGLVGLVGLVPLLTGIVGSCPIYSILGISTCSLPTTTRT